MHDRFRPTLHIRPERGWVNDPNGIIDAGGRTHVFFQYNPDSPTHTNIHWGHYSSSDGVRWDEHPVALAPTPGGIDAAGCWSGVATWEDERDDFALVYSGVQPGLTDISYPVVARRRDTDADVWDDKTPVELDPYSPDIAQVRDPFLFTAAGRRWALQGAGYHDGRACILLYAVDNLTHWRLVSTLLTSDAVPEEAQAEVWECPQIVEITPGRYALFVALWKSVNRVAASNLAACEWIVGDIDFTTETPTMHSTDVGRVDHGPDFYAPQIARLCAGNVLWGWTWESHEEDEATRIARGYQGALTFPRVLRFRNDRPVWELPEALTALRARTLDVNEVSSVHAWEAIVSASSATTIGIANKEFTVADTTRILVDGNLVEIFEGEPCERPRTVRVDATDGVALRVPNGVEVHCWELASTRADHSRGGATEAR